ncbi:hypothetical protein NEOLEDRAFT_1134428 [Neolentinus lepideus HHB14362 ss-1]|uniref:Uncharacterized protein n=1 Tax=Neolentinus lepideus HHB14362 ss-1 TaxID=1314782 RepID=A0A165S843_9AGAM|nr:hypothetical protein NEOLEDRAFT_1134428 [Neolentinus lepideus HHB14362 ss-1]
MQKFDPSVNPLYSPIVGTIPLPDVGTPNATPVMPPYHLPVQGSHLGLYHSPPQAPSPALSAASVSSSSSAHSHRSLRSHTSDGHGYQHYYGNPNKQLSALSSPSVKVITTPPMSMYSSVHPSSKHAHTHPPYRPTHAPTHSRTYPSHAPLPHQAYPDYEYSRPHT